METAEGRTGFVFLPSDAAVAEASHSHFLGLNIVQGEKACTSQHKKKSGLSGEARWEQSGAGGEMAERGPSVPRQPLHFTVHTPAP